jgi:hypothetical protein
MSARSLLALVALTAGGLAAGCSSSDSNTSTGPDNSAAPALLSVAPLGGATNVSRTGPMVMQFDGAMGMGMEQYIDLHRGTTADSTRPMICTWSSDRMTVTCTPSTPMDSLTQYTLHMGGGMKGADSMMVNMSKATRMGGQTVKIGSMGSMGDMHAGQSMSMMGSGWKASDGSYGMMFSFRTGS